tara:strand:- start:10653 stop:11054 length:402 start_codon:yes stop_codon:yes gene_type:complete
MSKYLLYDTEYEDWDCVIEALVEMGYPREAMRFSETKVSLQGYKGDLRSQKANLVIPKKYVGSKANDLGFEMIDGKIVMHLSEYDKSSTFTKYKQNKLKALYQKQTILKAAKKLKKKVKVTQEKGKIRMEILA